MDIFNELCSWDTLVLGCDLLAMGYCLKQLLSNERNLKNIREAKTFPICKQLKKHVEDEDGQKISYAVVRGLVTVKDSQFLTQSAPPVLEIQNIREHIFKRSVFGNWSLNYNIKNPFSNAIPFKLCSNDDSVTVSNPLSATILNSQILSSTYQPHETNAFRSFLTFLLGSRKQGEDIVVTGIRQGAMVTAVGELFVENNELYIGPSDKGPFMLTLKNKTSLLEPFKATRNKYIVSTALFCGVAAMLATLIILRIRAKDKKKKEHLE